jgi:hypothetical protein
LDLWTIRCVGVILKSRALRLLAALAVLAAGNLFYLSWDAAPPERAPAGHLLALMDGSPSPFAMPAALVARVAGPSPGNCAMANLFWAALLAAAMYRIGRRLHGETAGLLGACLLLVYPAVFGLTREFRPHVAALAMTALGFRSSWSPGSSGPQGARSSSAPPSAWRRSSSRCACSSSSRRWSTCWCASRAKRCGPASSEARRCEASREPEGRC